MKLALRVVLSVLGLTLPIYAFASVANFQITATDPYNDLITGTILTTGQAGPLGSDPLAGIFTNNVISYNLIGTGPLFGTDSPVSITGPGSYLYYSGLGVVCLLSSGTVGQCPQSPGPAPGQYNQTVFNFGGSAFLSPCTASMLKPSARARLLIVAMLWQPNFQQLGTANGVANGARFSYRLTESEPGPVSDPQYHPPFTPNVAVARRLEAETPNVVRTQAQPDPHASIPDKCRVCARRRARSHRPAS